MSKSKTFSLELTAKQFLNLMKAVYLGNWVANAFRVGKMRRDYESTEDLIFSYAPLFGYPNYMDHESKDGNRYYPTSYFEAETGVHEVHQDYDEETFWDELTTRMAERDFSREYSPKEIKAISLDERLEKLWELEEKWGKVFEKDGIEKLELKRAK